MKALPYQADRVAEDLPRPLRSDEDFVQSRVHLDLPVDGFLPIPEVAFMRAGAIVAGTIRNSSSLAIIWIFRSPDLSLTGACRRD